MQSHATQTLLVLTKVDSDNHLVANNFEQLAPIINTKNYFHKNIFGNKLNVLGIRYSPCQLLPSASKF